MTTITERAGTLTRPAKGSRWRARLIESDAKGKQGSSGYYPREVLERDGPAVFDAKPIYFDHPGETERYDRPERSVRDLAGKIVTRPAMEADGLYADVEFYSWAAPIVEEMAGDIGMSIRASASVEASTDKTVTGPVITALHEAQSVDLVTRAGAGGKLVSLLESARAAGDAPVGEAVASDTADLLYRAVRATYGTDSWVQDYDPEAALVYYSRRVGTGDDDYTSGTFREGYGVADDGLTITLSGDPVEVRGRTEYVPVTTTTDATEASPQSPVAPAGSTPTHESQEDTMQQIEESRLAQLEADAGRVQTLESERDAANQRAERAEEALAANDRTTKARTIIAAQAREAHVEFSPLEETGLLAHLPVKDGDLDEGAYTAAVAEAAADKAKQAGAGAIRGFGATTDGTDYAAEADKAVAGAFGRQIKEA